MQNFLTKTLKTVITTKGLFMRRFIKTGHKTSKKRKLKKKLQNEHKSLQQNKTYYGSRIVLISILNKLLENIDF